ncbi:MAG: MurR/RpiR family transcriptional regulator [Hyphomicrobiaceae bacterium]
MSDKAKPATDLRDLLDRVTRNFQDLPPQLQAAARHILDAPQDVAIKSMRGLAADAGVPPSTMVRLARASGYAGFEEFRAVFQNAIRTAGTDLVSRAEWLQTLPEGGRSSQVLAGMAGAILANIETAFRGNELQSLTAAADALRGARRLVVVGVGGMHAIAAYLAYVARMALADVRLAEPAMATMIDELAEIGRGDAVVLLSVAPYASESVRTAEFVARRGASLVIVTDSRTSPVAPYASVMLIVPTATPQFFPSQAAMIGLIETVIALVVSHGDRHVLERIERVDRLRRDEGIYWRRKG